MVNSIILPVGKCLPLMTHAWHWSYRRVETKHGHGWLGFTGWCAVSTVNYRFGSLLLWIVIRPMYEVLGNAYTDIGNIDIDLPLTFREQTNGWRLNSSELHGSGRRRNRGLRIWCRGRTLCKFQTPWQFSEGFSEQRSDISLDFPSGMIRETKHLLPSEVHLDVIKKWRLASREHQVGLPGRSWSPIGSHAVGPMRAGIAIRLSPQHQQDCHQEQVIYAGGLFMWDPRFSNNHQHFFRTCKWTSDLGFKVGNVPLVWILQSERVFIQLTSIYIHLSK